MRCDGCGRRASEAHLRERTARLEWATRFRPIHIGVLFLADAPPLDIADDFYRFANDSAGRSASSRTLFQELMYGAGPEPGSFTNEEAALAEFQHRGFYLAYARECPFEEGDPGNGQETVAPLSCKDFAREFGLTMVKRIQFSYKPKRIVLLSGVTRDLIPVLEQAGVGDLLLLDRGAPFELRPGLGLQIRKLLTPSS